MGGEYWGEQGFARVKSGSLALERDCAWAVPKDFTAPEKQNQFHCYEDGSNCNAKTPPSETKVKLARRSELLSREETEALGVVWHGNSSAHPSHLDLEAPKQGYPTDFSWCNNNGT